MQVTIVEKGPIHLVGMHIRSSLANNGTMALWQGFKPGIGFLQGVDPAVSFSVSRYDNLDSVINFHPNTEFEKWAAVEQLDLSFEVTRRDGAIGNRTRAVCTLSLQRCGFGFWRCYGALLRSVVAPIWICA